MSLPAALARIDQIHALLAPATTAPAPAPAPAPAAMTAASAGGSAFAGQLQAASMGPSSTSSVLAGALGANVMAAGGLSTSALGLATAAPTGTGGTGPGAAALAAAEGEVGVSERPPGSNDAPRIAEYRQATTGSGVGPWCGYFVSWAARQAGAPLGERGQGLGSVAAIGDWAQRTGRSLPAGSVPQPGDLILWGSRHVGIVESVGTDGSIHTVEGNSSDAVSRRSYGPDGGGATSYVRLG